ncbi:MAG: hypothetical protein ABEK10_04025 [Candidatus Nanosalina sp.]
MASNIERIEKIQQEIQKLMSETEEKEEKVGNDLKTVEEKIEYLEENLFDARKNNQVEEMVEKFIDACHHLTADLRTEKEIQNEIEQLKEDEKNYTQLLNRLQSQDLSDEKRQRVQSLIGKIPREKVEEAINEDRKLERNEETSTREQIQKLSEVYKDLEFNLKSGRRRSELEDAREAWVQLTHLEGNIH